MANNIYIGNRYVPIFADPIEWDNLREYEPLTIVTYLGTSYTSKKTVPAGTVLNNTEYWAVTGNYNAQVEAYRQEVADLSDDVDNIVDTSATITPEYLGAAGNGATDDTTFVQAALDSGKTVVLEGVYLIDSSLSVSSGAIITGNGKLVHGGSYNRKLLEITDGNVRISNIEIDGNDTAAVGIWAENCDNVIIENVYVHDLKNTADDHFHTAGIYVNNCINGIVRNSIVRNVDRLTLDAGLYASRGITISTTCSGEVSNCYIDTVKSQVSHGDCDGIDVAYHGATPIDNNVVGVVTNNVIKNCYGRFVKTQCAKSIINNNYCDNSGLSISSNESHSAFSSQYGDAEIKNNYVNMGNYVSHSYTYLINWIFFKNKNNIEVAGNKFVDGGSSDYARTFLRATVGVTSQTDILIDMHDNVIDQKNQSACYIDGVTGALNPTGKIKVANNSLRTFNVIENIIAATLKTFFVEVVNNITSIAVGSNKTRVSPDAYPFANIIYKGNVNAQYLINDGTDFDDIDYCDINYAGYSSWKINNVPAAMGDGQHLILKVDREAGIAEYCNYANDTDMHVYAF